MSRRAVLSSLALVAMWAFWALDLRLGDLWPNASGRELMLRFLSQALRPAWRSQSVEAFPLWPSVFDAVYQTLLLAVAATSLAILLALPLGILASRRWWTLGDPERPVRRRFLFVSCRALIAGLRSVHELLWAVLFLAALGLSSLAAVVAIAIPFTGVLAKIYSELLDEAPREAADALAAIGASRLQVFFFGLLPRALPDMFAYSLYRFECSIRSAAVMGFFGFPTLGYTIAASFENLYFREVWTYLYVLAVLVIAVEGWSGWVRRRSISEGWRWRTQLMVFGASGALAWWFGGFGTLGLLEARRLQNLERFLADLRPFPLQGRSFDISIAWDWLVGLWSSVGAEAAWTTLAISCLAISLAGLGALPFSCFAARTWSQPQPFLPGPSSPSWLQLSVWRGAVAISRGLLIFFRSIPEYVWAFLLLAGFGPSVWALVLALALHNVGILGKLGAEVIEDLEPERLMALRALGAGRGQIALFGVFPEVFNRFLLLFFYRWETCVRESTVLGMLGVASLGYWIQDARARHQYDTLLFLILVGASLVLLGDVISVWIRRQLHT